MQDKIAKPNIITNSEVKAPMSQEEIQAHIDSFVPAVEFHKREMGAADIFNALKEPERIVNTLSFKESPAYWTPDEFKDSGLYLHKGCFWYAYAALPDLREPGTVHLDRVLQHANEIFDAANEQGLKNIQANS